MTGPYSTTIRSSNAVLEVCTQAGTLATHLRFAHLAAAQWVMAGLCSAVDMDTLDAKGALVRGHVVYSKGGGLLANSMVMERVQ